MNTYIKTLIVTIFAGIATSCSDFLDVENYEGLPADDFVTSVSNAQVVLNGAYNGLYGQNLFYFGIYYYMDFATGELDFRASDESVKPLVDFGYYEGSTFITMYWKDLYTIISRSNDACSKMYKLRNGGTLSDSDNGKLNQMIGECNFLRGFAYFYLTRSFGDKLPSHPQYNPGDLGVPIQDTLIVSKSQVMIPRNTLGECWSEIIKDFETAYNLLPKSWDDTKLGAATKGAAAGYLGQVYMYMKDYGKAKEWFEKAMQAGNQKGGMYELTGDYAWNFDYNHENNSESLFEVQSQMVNLDYTSLASYLWRRLGPDGKGYGMVGVNQKYVDKFSVGYELTQETYDELMPQIIIGSTDIVIQELLKAYQPYIGISTYTKEEFFDLYTGDWNVLGDEINAILTANKFRRNVKTEYGWGTVNHSVMQTIVNASVGADPRMYDSFYVPGRDSIALDWAATQIRPYTNNYYGFKKYVPYNAVESWSGQTPPLPGTDGFNNINQRIFRLADLYLQYAEACYKAGDPDNAKKYLNKVRRRAWGYPFDDASMSTPESVDYPSAVDSGDFMAALIAEREKELCIEGVLWFDYLRWNMAEELFGDRGFDPKKHHRLPIPLSERQIVGMNILLQNDNY